MRWSTVRAISVSTVSRARKAASATVGPSRVRSLPTASVVCLSTLAMRRATTCAVTRSVSGNATRMVPSSSRQAMSLARSSRAVMRAASRLARRFVNESNVNRASESPTPFATRAFGGAIELAQEHLARQQAGVRRDDALLVERGGDALEPRRESMHPREGDDMRGDRLRIAAHLVDVRHALGVEFAHAVARHDHRQVAPARIGAEFFDEIPRRPSD